MGTFLRLLHPVMPFVSEELYHHLGCLDASGLLMEEPWPAPMDAKLLHRLGATGELVAKVSAKFELIRGVRNIRAGYLIPSARRIEVVIVSDSLDDAEFLQRDTTSLRALLYASKVEVILAGKPEGPTGVAVVDMGTAYVPLAGIIDVEAEKERLQKQKLEALGFIEKARRKLENQGFVAKAPAEVVARERERLQELTGKVERLHEQLRTLE
jgi:valyl-tRNA synthetase